MITGCISETMFGPVGILYFLFALNALCATCYVLIWLIIRFKNGDKQKIFSCGIFIFSLSSPLYFAKEKKCPFRQ